MEHSKELEVNQELAVANPGTELNLDKPEPGNPDTEAYLEQVVRPQLANPDTDPDLNPELADRQLVGTVDTVANPESVERQFMEHSQEVAAKLESLEGSPDRSETE